MPSRPPPTAAHPARRATEDLRGLARLTTDGVVGITGVVEAMHHTIAQRAGLRLAAPSERLGGITGVVYTSVKLTARLTGRVVEGLVQLLPPSEAGVSPAREAFVSALNGVWGDHLAESGNPLAIPMTLAHSRNEGNAPGQQPTGRLLVLVHGLAMNDLQWLRQGHDHGQALARDGGFTPLYLRYNSGLHVSRNGAEFSELLERTLAAWPVPVEELVIVGHSMGGLVARSACIAGARARWRRSLKALVCLGTPHHGAPLEKAGSVADWLLGATPYAAPLARLGGARSAGIVDLRFGHVQESDWAGRPPKGGRHAPLSDTRQPAPLPRGVKTFFVAAVRGPSARGLRAATLGDGLVPLTSALGEHADPRLSLKVPADRRLVVNSANHFDLLSDPRVYAALKEWLAPGPGA